MKKNKKGIHHVEYVIAVSIFFMSLFFFVYFYSVSIKEKLPLEELEKIFLEKTQVNVTIVSLFIKEVGSSCYNLSLNSNFAPEQTRILLKKGSLVVPFNISGDYILVGTSGNLTMFYLDSSQISFDSERVYVASCAIGNYNYSLPYSEKFIFKTLLENINDKEIEEKIGKKFFINVSWGTQTIIKGKIPPKSVEIRAKDTKMRIIDEKGDIALVKVLLQVW